MTRGGVVGLAGAALVLLAPAPAAAGFLDDLLAPFKRATEPAATAPAEDEDEPFCPTVDVFEGGAALRAYAGGSAGDSGSLRHQISIANLARECRTAPGGGLVVKVGIEGRALIGPVGAAGTFSAPLTVQVKRGEIVVARRSRSVAVTIPAGQTQGSFTVIEEGIAVPPGPGYISIEAGMGAPAGSAADARERRQRR